MRFKTIHDDSFRILVLDEPSTIFTDRDATDIIGAAFGSAAVIIPKENLDSRFWELRSGMAGEFLQKFVNYNIKLAIVGDFSQITSKSLRDFIYESNKGPHIFFCPSTEEALKALGCTGIQTAE